MHTCCNENRRSPGDVTTATRSLAAAAHKAYSSTIRPRNQVLSIDPKTDSYITLSYREIG